MRVSDESSLKVCNRNLQSSRFTIKIILFHVEKFTSQVSPGNGTIAHFFRILLRPEVFLLAIIIFVFCFYLQAIELSANGFITRISNSLRFKSSANRISFASSIAEKDSWEEKKKQSAVYAVQGRRPHMEDR